MPPMGSASSRRPRQPGCDVRLPGCQTQTRLNHAGHALAGTIGEEGRGAQQADPAREGCRSGRLVQNAVVASATGSGADTGKRAERSILANGKSAHMWHLFPIFQDAQNGLLFGG